MLRLSEKMVIWKDFDECLPEALYLDLALFCLESSRSQSGSSCKEAGMMEQSLPFLDGRCS